MDDAGERARRGASERFCAWKRPGRLRDRWHRLWALELVALGFPSGARRPYRLRNLRNAFLVGLALFAFSEADPFGVGDATDRYSAEIFQRLVAPSYDRSQSDRIRVVLLTDRYVEQRDGWPLPFSEHAEILGALLAFLPEAVFVDFGFLDARNDASVLSLQEIADAYDGEGVGLYFVRGRAGKGRPNGIIEALNKVELVSGAFWPDRYELFDCRLGTRSAALALAEHHGLFSMAAVEARPRGRGRGRKGPAMKPGAAPGPGTAADGAPGSAGAAFRSGCPTKESLDSGASWPFRPPGCPGNLPGGDARLCMDIVWSDWGGGDTGKNGAQECKRGFRPGLLMVLDPLYGFLNDLGLGFIQPFGGQSCAPHRSVTVTDLMLAEQAAAREADPERRDDLLQELHGFLAGRIVIYGGHLEMADDLFQPPTHEPLPGAYYHAMALDNLLSLGPSGYTVQEPHIGGRRIAWLVDALTFGLATVITGFFARAAIDPGAPGRVARDRYWAALRAYLLRSALWSALGLLALLGFFVVLARIEFNWFDWGPANFVGVLGLQFAWWLSFLRTWWEHRPRRAGQAEPSWDS